MTSPLTTSKGGTQAGGVREIRVRLAAAVLRIAELYSATPNGARPDVNGGSWQVLEDQIQAALDTGDRDRALTAIASWEAHGRRVLAGEGR